MRARGYGVSAKGREALARTTAPAELTRDTHPCPVAGCTTRVSGSVLMCGPHWRAVPVGLGNEVTRAWRWRLREPGSESAQRQHRHVMRQAIQAVEAWEETSGKGPPISAISLWEPWASALVLGPKPIENRSWRIKIPAGGRWLAIHVSKQCDSAEAFAKVAEVWPGHPTNARAGQIIGAVRIDRCVRVEDLEGELATSPWVTGPWVWVVGKKVPLDHSLPMLGRQGLWDPPAQSILDLYAAGVS